MSAGQVMMATACAMVVLGFVIGDRAVVASIPVFWLGLAVHSLA